MFTLKKLWLAKDKLAYQAWQQLLLAADLDPHEVVDYTIGIYDDQQLVATGSLTSNIIKCVAVSKAYQSENLLTKVMMHLMETLRENGYQHYFVYTKPSNLMIFQSLGFQKIIDTDTILFMEQGSPDFSDYLAFLKENKKVGTASGTVMNANPFTKGHQYLIETAASQSQQVYVFVLSEDRSEFSSEERLALVKAGTAHLENVTILPTNDYMVSSATFPAYFLKEKAELAVAKVQATLDAQLFKDRIAPLLEITTRFVGEEPFSEVTELYNQSMQQVFGDELALVVLPRKMIAGEAISATKVRAALQAGDLALLKQFLPVTTYDYLKKAGKLPAKE
ncbi:[citrate (pro-3S)-lyase] ligase [Enterococcus sp. PF1-24]|uniref:[citrate (pro-3S)-lyase] ligase n=1 Tax=unclassified Enterococcus TaxID=2608891 RepID=UPI002474D094|nr:MULTISPECIES: [citrate (pro-3S)-lyase] ligase [unclassified Enterococcus]MDH6365825.1 [citrate (pro-3S)-lyase] ligase [Enterococcus sp. PFB1-1]MDH6400761.1 [citrate (pro-3S)-lyase] ligase [Enterococcus sp. PF1-24]